MESIHIIIALAIVAIVLVVYMIISKNPNLNVTKQGVFIYVLNPKSSDNKKIEKIKISDNVNDLSNLYIPKDVYSKFGMSQGNITLFIVVDYGVENKSIRQVSNDAFGDSKNQENIGNKVKNGELAVAVPMILPFEIFDKVIKNKEPKSLNPEESVLFNKNNNKGGESRESRMKQISFSTPITSNLFIVGTIIDMYEFSIRGNNVIVPILKDVPLHKLIIN